MSSAPLTAAKLASTDEKDMVSADGSMRYITDLGCNLENCEWFIPMEIVQAKALAQMEKDGFINGWKALGYVTPSSSRTPF